MTAAVIGCIGSKLPTEAHSAARRPKLQQVDLAAADLRTNLNECLP
jgi:hypothetical protein